MNPSQAITPRPKMEITDVDNLGNNNDDHLQDDDATPSQGPSIHTTINSIAIASITTQIQSEVNASLSGDETTPMLRQALADAPNPTSFLQTPSPNPSNNDFSWDIGDDTDYSLYMHYLLRESFQ